MEQLDTFFDMGGYAAFVWPAFGLTALGMVGLLILTHRQLSRRQRELNRLEKDRTPQRERQN
jgi:heme exporter protein D